MSAKERLRAAIDGMTDAEAEAALWRIEGRADPVLRNLEAAPIDDEPATPEEDVAAAAAYAMVDGGAPTVALDDLRRELGSPPPRYVGAGDVETFDAEPRLLEDFPPDAGLIVFEGAEATALLASMATGTASAEYLRESDRVFAELYSPEPTNDLFR